MRVCPRGRLQHQTPNDKKAIMEVLTGLYKDRNAQRHED